MQSADNSLLRERNIFLRKVINNIALVEGFLLVEFKKPSPVVVINLWNNLEEALNPCLYYLHWKKRVITMALRQPAHQGIY